MNDLISIVIPVYNAENFIKDTIENILQQTYTNWELILVDDNSKDNSASIIEKYVCDKIKLIRLSKNSGPANARNIGISYIKGKYLCFQDADDLWEKEKLKKQLEFMKQKQCAFSYTSFEYADEHGKGNGKQVHIQEKLEYKEALKNIKILTISVMLDTSKIPEKLLYMPDIDSEDVAMWWNLLKNGITAYGIDKVLVYYRRTKTSLTANKFKWCIKRWNLYRKFEKFSILKSSYYFYHYAKNAVIKRI